MVLPSGEICGSATRANRPRLSMPNRAQNEGAQENAARRHAMATLMEDTSSVIFHDNRRTSESGQPQRRKGSPALTLGLWNQIRRSFPRTGLGSYPDSW